MKKETQKTILLDSRKSCLNECIMVIGYVASICKGAMKLTQKKKITQWKNLHSIQAGWEDKENKLNFVWIVPTFQDLPSEHCGYLWDVIALIGCAANCPTTGGSTVHLWNLEFYW